MTDSEKIAARMEQLTTQDRRRAIFGRRFCYNVCRWPWAFVLAILALIAVMYATTIVNILPPGDGNFSTLLVLLWDFAGKLIILIIPTFVVMVVFTAPPPQAQTYEAALVRIEFTDTYGNGPALVSRHRRNSANNDIIIEELVFYSGGIKLKEWEKQQENIQDALNVTYVELPKYAYKKRYYTCLTVTFGIGSPPSQLLYDDEL